MPELSTHCAQAAASSLGEHLFFTPAGRGQQEAPHLRRHQYFGVNCSFLLGPQRHFSPFASSPVAFPNLCELSGCSKPTSQDRWQRRRMERDQQAVGLNLPPPSHSACSRAPAPPLGSAGRAAWIPAFHLFGKLLLVPPALCRQGLGLPTLQPPISSKAAQPRQGPSLAREVKFSPPFAFLQRLSRGALNLLLCFPTGTAEKCLHPSRQS